MSQSDPQMLIGRLALHYKILSKEQVAEAVRRWRTEAAGQDLGTFMESRRLRVDATLEEYLPAETERPALLHKAMRYSVFAGGKRFRPV